MYTFLMAQGTYRHALDAAKREYQDLVAQRDILQKRISNLERTIENLAGLCGESISFSDTPANNWARSMGFTDAIRTSLKIAGKPLTAVEVKERIEAGGFQLSKYHNPHSSIHSILRRLADAGEASLSAGPGGKTAYQWGGGTAVAQIDETKYRKTR